MFCRIVIGRGMFFPDEGITLSVGLYNKKIYAQNLQNTGLKTPGHANVQLTPAVGNTLWLPLALRGCRVIAIG